MYKTIAAGLILLAMAVAAAITPRDGAAEPGPQLIGRIDYRFVGHLEQTDGAGRLLVWEADVEGALSGTMKWWFDTPPPVGEVAIGGGRVTFYSARWELWRDGSRLLAGVSTGKTVFSGGGDGIWDGHGTVTEGGGDYSALLGRRVYETGPVILGSDPPVSLAGTGLFAIY